MNDLGPAVAMRQVAVNLLRPQGTFPLFVTLPATSEAFYLDSPYQGVLLIAMMTFAVACSIWMREAPGIAVAQASTALA